MMELVDILGLGSSSYSESRGSSPLFGKSKKCQLIINYVIIKEEKKKN